MNSKFELEEIWGRTLKFLKDDLPEISFTTWINTLKPVSMTNNSITLCAPTDFNKGIIESRYLSLIQNAIKMVTHKEYCISVTTTMADEQTTQNETKINQNEDITHSFLNPKYTFDTFVIGNGNMLAHAAALAVAESPAAAYNPLFIYGGVGLGKTHLMHAIGHYVLNQYSHYKVLYVSSEKFTNELINAIKDDRNDEFRNKYRNIDILLIDDIQFIGGKERTQEEFFHTFNALYEANKQIIISSDKPPKDITTLEDRLRSRFEWGLIADISPPDFETRIAILRKKAQLEKIDIPDAVTTFIADKVASNIRELEGALNKIIAYSTIVKSPITVDLAMEALKDMLASKQAKVINCVTIQDTVARYFDIKPIEFKSKKRNREIAYPRQIAMFLCRELTDLSLPKIGEEFGGRDHTTVIHANEKIEKELKTNSELKRTIEELKRSITGR